MLRSQFVLFVVVGIGGCSKATDQSASARTEAERLYQQGTKLLETDPEQAARLFTKSLELIPEAPPTLYNRAVAYARLGRDAEAVADITRLERLDPRIGKQLRVKMSHSAAPYTDLATAEYKAKNYVVAIQKCDSALAYDPSFGDAWVVKALALLALDQPEKALECFNQGAAAEPTNYLVFLNRAEHHFRHNRFQPALADFDRAIQLSPTEADAFVGRSAVHAALQMPDKAAADETQAAKLKAQRGTRDAH